MNLLKDKILLTGATGLIGGEIYYRLPNKSNVYVLCRNGKNAQERLLKRQKAIVGNNSKDRFNIIEGDITKPNWELKEFDYDIIIHAAGDTSFIHKKQCIETNVVGIKNLIELIKKSEKKPYLVYFGTASSHGAVKNQTIDETFKPLDKFYNTYTETKKTSEDLIKKYLSNYLIIRPTIVLGDNVMDVDLSCSIGWAFYVTKYFKELPFSPMSKMDYVPVSYVGKVIMKLLENEPKHKEYIVSCGKDRSKNMSQIMDFLHTELKRKIKIVIDEKLKTDYTGLERKLFPAIKHYLPFVNMNIIYDNKRLISESADLINVPPLFEYLGHVLRQVDESSALKEILNP
jgi:nucleoside-diphosphate-sugar epimerase